MRTFILIVLFFLTVIVYADSPNTESTGFLQTTSRRYAVSLGVNWIGVDGMDFYFVSPTLEATFADHFSVALTGGYNQRTLGGAHTKTYLAALTLNAYSQAPLEGFWVQLGAGKYFYDLQMSSTKASDSSFLLLSTLGWKFHAAQTAGSIGIAGGAQMIFSNGDTRIVPCLTASFGIDF